MKYTEQIIEQIESSIQRGVSIKRTCDLVGISQETFYQWMKDKDKVEFSDRIKRARAEKIAFLLDNIRVAGIGQTICTCRECGAKNTVTIPTKQWQSLAWILERTESDDFVVKVKNEVTGKDGNPIQTENVDKLEKVINNMSEKDRKTFFEIYERSNGVK